MQELTLRKLRNTKFKDLYLQLLKGEEMGDAAEIRLLAISVLLLNHESAEIKKLGYRIILIYGNATGKYQALYDIAVNTGLHPISAVIENNFENDEPRGGEFLRSILSSYIDTFRDQNIVLTEQQDALRKFIQSEYEKSSVVVAPTSYGKSELIVKSVKDNPKKSVLILVPSKALLSQTKKRIIDADIKELGKIVTHPEMYSENGANRVCVLTQERLNRLLHERPALSFDMVFVDEAHNLLQNDRRSELLATMLCVLGARGAKTAFKFLTPFLCDELNLRVRYLDMNPTGFRIDEYIKTERFYLRDFRSGTTDSNLRFYDHFLDEWVKLDGNYPNCFDLIEKESLSKNIIYGNKKKSIEEFALRLAISLPNVNCPQINRACDELQEIFDPRYRLISCLRKGVMYHHGSIPDTVRLYLENLFSKAPKLKYLVCNSTLLEGVNLPIERLFVFDYMKGTSALTSSQFKNLIGRVNRFSEVFSSKNSSALQKLESKIFLIGIDEFTRKRANLQEFYKKTVHVMQADRDSVGNVLLEATEIVDGLVSDRFDDAVERLENLHRGVVTGRECRYVTTNVGRLLIANSISEIDVFNKELKISEEIKNKIERDGIVDSADSLMLMIKECFIDHFDEGRGYSDLKRLNNSAAIRFYAMILDWKIKKYGIKETIRLTLRYWDELVSTGQSDYVFVGTWGDTTFGEGHREHWVRISTKDDVERVNLAIVRIKEEDDFFDYKIFRFVEILNDVGALDEQFYKKIKYGTTEDIQIRMIRDGFSRTLIDLIQKKYPEKVKLTKSGEIEIDPSLIASMIANEESDLLVFEAEMNTRSLADIDGS